MRIVTVLVAGLLLIVTPASAHVLDRDEQCRFQQRDRASWTQHEVRLTVDCFGRREGIVNKAEAVAQCESSMTAEKQRHSTSYHGTYQYLRQTFHNQQHQVRVQVRKFQLSNRVHNPRANIGTAIMWAARYGWGPWACG